MPADEAKITVRVYPGAPRSQIVGLAEGAWRIKVAAPPLEGKANKELVDFLSKLLDVSKSSVTITQGLTSRNKVITVEGLSQAEVNRRLLAKP